MERSLPSLLPTQLKQSSLAQLTSPLMCFFYKRADKFKEEGLEKGLEKSREEGHKEGCEELASLK